MNVSIIGWYGTETLGDRAILIGILKVLSSIDEEMNISLGSLAPFFTRRTLAEDAKIYLKINPKLNIELFDSRDSIQIKKQVANSDLIIMGGGPLLDITEIEIIRYTFELGKKLHKKTMIFGCGIGPLVYKQNRKIVAQILKKTDLAIFRDKRGVEEAKILCPLESSGNWHHCHDPAILSIMDYESPRVESKSNTISINCRKFPSSAFGGMRINKEDFLIKMIQRASEFYENVKLVPMHTFHMGGDDRKYLSELCLRSCRSNVSVQHKPMNLYGLFDVFSKSDACIGMRYHSVVFQTLLNGNNYILDYTESKKGKISGFLDCIDTNFYKDRIVNLQESMPPGELIEQSLCLLKRNRSFIYSSSIFDETLEFYKKKITELLK